MPFTAISTLDDPRIQVYRQLPKSNLTRWSGRFIAEGERLLRRLLASQFEIESILLSDRRETQVRAWLPGGIPVYVLPHAAARELVGYNFHGGILACGRRRKAASLVELVPGAGDALLVALSHVTDPENLGKIIRTAAGFGANAVLLERGCADPFSRRVLRTSSGAVLEIPLYETAELLPELRRLRESSGLRICAAVLAEDAVPLESVPRSSRVCLAFGNEAAGLRDDWQQAADLRATIPMARGTDSLNVAVAAGIFLYHVTRNQR